MIFASDNISCFIFSKRNDNATIVFIFFNFFISFNSSQKRKRLCSSFHIPRLIWVCL